MKDRNILESVFETEMHFKVGLKVPIFAKTSSVSATVISYSKQLKWGTLSM